MTNQKKKRKLKKEKEERNGVVRPLADDGLGFIDGLVEMLEDIVEGISAGDVDFS